MKELSLSLAAGEFEMINAETHLFYNIEESNSTAGCTLLYRRV